MQGKAIIPCTNLVSNIGFGEDATHTFVPRAQTVNHQNINFPIKDNPFMIPDRKYDLLWLDDVSITRKIIRRLKNIFSR